MLGFYTPIDSAIVNSRKNTHFEPVRGLITSSSMDADVLVVALLNRTKNVELELQVSYGHLL